MINSYSLRNYVNEQKQLLHDVLTGMDVDSKAALALICGRNGSLNSPLMLLISEKTAIERIGSSLGGCTSALEALKGSMVSLINNEDSLYWTFRHPTIGDAFGNLLATETELLEIFLTGSPVEKLIDQITCGDRGATGFCYCAKELFSIVVHRLEGSLKKIKALKQNTWHYGVLKLNLIDF